MPMTPAEARFIELWEQGVETAEIARQLGLKATTAQSRAYRLQQRGLIQPRPRGGNYPSQQALARQDGAEGSSDTPRVSKRVSPGTHQRSAGVSPRVSPDTPSAQYLPPSQGELSPLLQEILQELRHLTGALADRVPSDTLGVHSDTPGVSGGVSARTPLPAERGKSVRWNLHLSEGFPEESEKFCTVGWPDRHRWDQHSHVPPLLTS